MRGQNLLGGLDPEKFDYFHENITHQEFTRILAPGFVDGIKAGLTIGLPPVLKYAQVMYYYKIKIIRNK